MSLIVPPPKRIPPHNFDSPTPSNNSTYSLEKQEITELPLSRGITPLSSSHGVPEATLGIPIASVELSVG